MDAGQFYSVLEHRRNRHIISSDEPTLTNTDRRKPTIDIDASQVGFRFIQVASGSAGYIFSMAVAFSLCGIDVNIIGSSVLKSNAS